MILSETELDAFLEAKHAGPHDLLGLHPCTHKRKKGLVARAFVREAVSCEVVAFGDEPEKRYPLEKLDEAGFFEGFIEGRKEPFAYRLRVELQNGEIRQFYDPYGFTPTLSETDLYLFNEGNDHRVYEKMGAHLKEVDGVPGVAFAVWAPTARRVSVVGDFNAWDGRFHPMRAMGASGVWEIFIPGLTAGEKYKFEIWGQDGFLRLKTDPYGTFFEPPPHNAAIVCDTGGYNWGDGEWLEGRAKTDWKKAPMSIYEVHPASWKRVVEDGGRPLTYREMASELVAYVKEMGYTHVEFMPLAEHPFAGSWGYQVTGFMAPTHRFGDPKDFMYLVDTLHQNGIGVIVDWVPGHFPKDSFALAEFDGSHLYEHADPRQGEHQDWGTLIFNYGRHEVRAFLVASALSWFDRYHIDGLRVDAVASMLYLDYSREEGQWIPNAYGGRENIEAIEFLRSTNELVHQYYPGALTIAEESTSFGMVSKPPSAGGLGFDFKWNMGWMHDSLQYFSKDPIHRKWHQNDLTFGMLYQYSEDFVHVYSHDEVVHGKGSMLLKMAAPSITDKAQTLRALYTLMWAWPGKKCLFMGNDFGQSTEWRYDGSLDWHLLQYLDHEGIRMLVCDLNTFYAETPVLYENDHNPHGFAWVACNDADHSVFAFLRRAEHGEACVLCVGHYTPVSREGYRIGVPKAGFWKERINSAADVYGGYGGGNGGGVQSEPVQCDGWEHSLLLTLPANSTSIFVLEG